MKKPTRSPFMVRLTTEEHKALTDAARKQGVTGSAYLRHLLREATGLNRS